MFAIIGSRGFHLSFKNGITLSTQFGGGNYCSMHDIEIGEEHLKNCLQSKDAEIAIFGTVENGKWLTQQAYKETFDEDIEDDVKGYVEVEEWLAILDWCRTYTPELAKAEEQKQRSKSNETTMRHMPC